jgi:predicted  nucleic acid-binding Zn-ribbon protein
VSQSQTFSDHNIRQTIEVLKTDGQNVTPWAVQSRLGGGDFLRIQQIIEQFYPKVNEGLVSTAKNSKDQKKEPEQSTDVEDILDKQMPAGIEASMYDMQTTLGKMANQLWNDAATNAEDQVRGKLFSAQEALKEAQLSQEQTAQANSQMQQQISQLTQDINSLDSNYNQAVKSLKHESKALQDAQKQCDELQHNVDSLQAENSNLEQEAFNANIKVAKAEGLAEIAKEQLALAKQSEKQAQKSLDRAEKKVDSLHKEMHDTSQALRDEMRERHVPVLPTVSEPSSASNLKEYPPQELPQPSSANLDALEPLAKADISYPNPDTSNQRAANNNSSSQSVSASPSQNSSPSIAQNQMTNDANNRAFVEQAPASIPRKSPVKKTRSLSDKLFDRKKRQNTNRNK